MDAALHQRHCSCCFVVRGSFAPSDHTARGPGDILEVLVVTAERFDARGSSFEIARLRRSIRTPAGARRIIVKVLAPFFTEFRPQMIDIATFPRPKDACTARARDSAVPKRTMKRSRPAVSCRRRCALSPLLLLLSLGLPSISSARQMANIASGLRSAEGCVRTDLSPIDGTISDVISDVVCILTPDGGPPHLIFDAPESTAKGIRIYASSGLAEGDPLTYRLEGRTDGASWEPISSGNFGPDWTAGAFRNARDVYIESSFEAGDGSLSFGETNFHNEAVYEQYRATFPTLRGGGDPYVLRIGALELVGEVEERDEEEGGDDADNKDEDEDEDEDEDNWDNEDNEDNEDNDDESYDAEILDGMEERRGNAQRRTRRPSTPRPTPPKPTNRPQAERTPRPSRKPTDRPTRRPTPPTRPPTPRPTRPGRTPKPTGRTPRPTPTPRPSNKPTPRPTRRPQTPRPTQRPREDRNRTPRPTRGPRPTPDPTPDPTRRPSRPPTPRPTRRPTTPSPGNRQCLCVPTDMPVAPTSFPTVSPTLAPTLSPTLSPSRDPTISPTSSPTYSPSYSPTDSPTLNPSVAPTLNPTLDPTASPTEYPTYSPTEIPTKSPSMSPTMFPIIGSPTTNPTIGPPTEWPTFVPTTSPTSSVPPTTLTRAPTHAPSGDKPHPKPWGGDGWHGAPPPAWGSPPNQHGGRPARPSQPWRGGEWNGRGVPPKWGRPPGWHGKENPPPDEWDANDPSMWGSPPRKKGQGSSPPGKWNADGPPRWGGPPRKKGQGGPPPGKWSAGGNPAWGKTKGRHGGQRKMTEQILEETGGHQTKDTMARHQTGKRISPLAGQGWEGDELSFPQDSRLGSSGRQHKMTKKFLKGQEDGQQGKEAVARRLQVQESTPWGIETVQSQEMRDAANADSMSPKLTPVICIINDGYDDGHPDLPNSQAHGVTGTSYVIQSSGKVQSWNQDVGKFGTHIAGTIGAIGNNGIGVTSINPSPRRFKFHIVRVHDKESNEPLTSLEKNWTINAINDCVDKGADVINIAVGFNFQADQLQIDMENALRRAYEAGVLIVAKAGNTGGNSQYYPASYPEVMSVSAIDRRGALYSNNNKNDQVEISAPGVQILSTTVRRQGSVGPTGKETGTGMASAHVAGVAALVWSYFPDCTNVQIRTALISSPSQPFCNQGFGWGIVNAERAYKFLKATLKEGKCGIATDVNNTAVGGCGQPIDSSIVLTPPPTTNSPTKRPTPNPTRRPTPSPKPITPRPTRGRTPRPTGRTPKPTNTRRPSNQPTPRPTRKPITPRPTRKPIEPNVKTSRPTPSLPPRPPPTNKPTRAPTPDPTPRPTPPPNTPRPTPARCLCVPTEVPVATAFPTLSPTLTPTVGPTLTPTIGPTLDPTLGPTVSPTLGPSLGPTLSPSLGPTLGPSLGPTLGPSLGPTVSPTLEPSLGPSLGPTALPTTVEPTLDPSVAPTLGPTDSPTLGPTPIPTLSPTLSPSINPTTAKPTLAPSPAPSLSPTKIPSESPTANPTVNPTDQPTPLKKAPPAPGTPAPAPAGTTPAPAPAGTTSAPALGTSPPTRVSKPSPPTSSSSSKSSLSGDIWSDDGWVDDDDDGWGSQWNRPNGWRPGRPGGAAGWGHAFPWFGKSAKAHRAHWGNHLYITPPGNGWRKSSWDGRSWATLRGDAYSNDNDQTTSYESESSSIPPTGLDNMSDQPTRTPTSAMSSSSNAYMNDNDQTTSYGSELGSSTQTGLDKPDRLRTPPAVVQEDHSESSSSNDDSNGNDQVASYRSDPRAGPPTRRPNAKDGSHWNDGREWGPRKDEDDWFRPGKSGKADEWSHAVWRPAKSIKFSKTHHGHPNDTIPGYPWGKSGKRFWSSSSRDSSGWARVSDEDDESSWDNPARNDDGWAMSYGPESEHDDYDSSLSNDAYSNDNDNYEFEPGSSPPTVRGNNPGTPTRRPTEKDGSHRSGSGKWRPQLDDDDGWSSDWAHLPGKSGKATMWGHDDWRTSKSGKYSEAHYGGIIDSIPGNHWGKSGKRSWLLDGDRGEGGDFSWGNDVQNDDGWAASYEPEPQEHESSKWSKTYPIWGSSGKSDKAYPIWGSRGKSKKDPYPDWVWLGIASSAKSSKGLPRWSDDWNTGHFDSGWNGKSHGDIVLGGRKPKAEKIGNFVLGGAMGGRKPKAEKHTESVEKVLIYAELGENSTKSTSAHIEEDSNTIEKVSKSPETTQTGDAGWEKAFGKSAKSLPYQFGQSAMITDKGIIGFESAGHKLGKTGKSKGAVAEIDKGSDAHGLAVPNDSEATGGEMSKATRLRPSKSAKPSSIEEDAERSSHDQSGRDANITKVQTLSSSKASKSLNVYPQTTEPQGSIASNDGDNPEKHLSGENKDQVSNYSKSSKPATTEAHQGALPFDHSDGKLSGEGTSGGGENLLEEALRTSVSKSAKSATGGAIMPTLHTPPQKPSSRGREPSITASLSTSTTSDQESGLAPGVEIGVSRPKGMAEGGIAFSEFRQKTRASDEVVASAVHSAPAWALLLLAAAAFLFYMW